MQELRDAYVLQPSLFTKDLFEATFTKGLTIDDWPERVKELRSSSSRHVNVPFATRVTLLLEFNVDGVALFESSAISGQFTPVLARVNGLKGEAGTFTFSGMLPFMVAYWNGICEPPDRVLNDLARELTERHPSVYTPSDRTVDYEVTDFAGPSRSSEPHASNELSDEEPFESDSDNEPIAETVSDEEGNAADCESGDSDIEGDATAAPNETVQVFNPVPTAQTEEDLNGDGSLDEVLEDLLVSVDCPSVCLETDRVIADAPANAKLRGTTSHGGYYALTKCTTRGIRYEPTPKSAGQIAPEGAGKGTKKGSVKYPETKCLRTNMYRDDDHWEDYFEVEDSELKHQRKMKKPKKSVRLTKDCFKLVQISIV